MLYTKNQKPAFKKVFPGRVLKKNNGCIPGLYQHPGGEYIDNPNVHFAK
jgi:hypothetical protein